MSSALDSFRTLIVLSLVSIAFAIFVSLNASPPPAELFEYYEWHGFGAVTRPEAQAWLWYPEMALLLGALVGMFFLWRYSLSAALVSVFISPVRAAFGGIHVSSPIEDAFWACHWIFFVLVLGMALFEPSISPHFRIWKRKPSEDGT